MTDRVVLVDGSAMVFRAFFAIPGNFSTATGLHTNAVYGFTLMFKKMFAGKTPSFGAVVFDAPGKTFRDEKFPAYKAQRPRMPGDLKEQLPWIDKVVEVHNFPILRVPGWEADDVIGTLAREAQEEGMEVHIISGDKDFAQLINDDVRMIDAIRDITYDSELVRKKWGVPPHQFVDLLALLGDSVDNIPGVPGVGQKGAATLLEKYGDLETILASTDELKGRQKSALTEHADTARLSKDLATIDVHVPLDQTVKDLVIKAPDQGTLNDLYKELEFYSLLEQDEVRDAFDDDKWDFKTLQTAAEVKAFLSEVKDDDVVAAFAVFDEPHPTVGQLVGIGLSNELGAAVFVPLSGDGIAEEGAREALKAWLEDASAQKVFHNVKWASIALRRAGVELKGTAFDTMLASFLVDPTKVIPHALFGIAKEYLHRTLPPQKSITGSGKSEKRFSEVELEQVSTWACHHVEAIKAAYPILVRRLESEGQTAHLFDVDLPLTWVLAQMEVDGIHVDPDDLKAMEREFQAKLDGLTAQVHEMGGRVFNINSTKQLSAVLFDEMKLPVIKRTKSGYSTNAEVLERLSDKGHAIADVLLEHRKITKLINTYTDVLQKAVHPHDGRIHCSFQQTVGATGRLITTEPDLQRTPVNTPEGLRVRQTFTAPPGMKMVSADWSQIELRLLAHVSADPLLVEAYTEEIDIHRRTAGEIFDIDPGDATDKQRGVGKTVNFATIYGQGATALGQQLKVPRKEAQRYIDTYFEAYGGVRRWLDDTMAQAHQDGFVTTLLGRRRYIPELSSNAFMERQAGERIAANTPIQGSAADICKLAMIFIAKRLADEGFLSRMVLQVHDELVFEAPEGEVDRLMAMVREVMESVVDLRVPLKVDIGAGPNWAAAKG